MGALALGPAALAKRFCGRGVAAVLSLLGGRKRETANLVPSVSALACVC